MILLSRLKVISDFSWEDWDPALGADDTAHNMTPHRPSKRYHPYDNIYPITSMRYHPYNNIDSLTLIRQHRYLTDDVEIVEQARGDIGFYVRAKTRLWTQMLGLYVIIGINTGSVIMLYYTETGRSTPTIYHGFHVSCSCFCSCACACSWACFVLFLLLFFLVLVFVFVLFFLFLFLLG